MAHQLVFNVKEVEGANPRYGDRLREWGMSFRPAGAK